MVAPLVSILVPAYNAERFLSQTLHSALAQTWSSKEVIVIDDGSSDKTYDIAMGFASANVKVIQQDNAGVCITRNRLFSLAQGDYIQWLDADDILAPEKIMKQMERRDGDGGSRTLLTSAWGSFFHRTSRAKFQPSGLWQDLSPLEWITIKFLESAWMNPTVWLVSRQLSEIAGPWDPRLASSGDDDGEYIVRVVRAATRVRFVPDAVCYYRIGVGGSLNWNLGIDQKRLASLASSLELSIKHLIEYNDTVESRHACLTYIKGWLDGFYGADDVTFDKIKRLGIILGERIDDPVAPSKYMVCEKLLGRATTAALMRKWRKSKLHAQSAVDECLWLLGSSWPFAETRESLR